MNSPAKIFLLLISPFVLLVAAGCNICTCKKITCAAFSDAAFDKWAPYKEDELLVFKNQAGTADTIRISAIRKSEAYESTSGGGYGCGKGCFTNGTAYGTDMTGSNIEKFTMNMDKRDPNGSSTPQTNYVSLRFKNLFINARSLADTGLVTATVFNEVKLATRFSNSLNILSKNFANVQTLMIDTNTVKFNGPFKIYISAGAGLIGWENYPDKTVWVKE
jgi:hypothetical protein